MMVACVYSVQDLQTRYKLSRSQAYAYVHNLPDELIIRFGKCIRIDKEGFDQYLDAQKSKQKSLP